MSANEMFGRLLPFLRFSRSELPQRGMAAFEQFSRAVPDDAASQASEESPRREKKRHRSIFISDVHLGTKGCNARMLLDFLKYNDADNIYLVGDIIDGWRLKSSWYWEQAHNDVVQKLLRKVRKGTRVVLLPGNHDEFLRDFTGLSFGGISIEPDWVHETAEGKRYLVIHGDLFDGVVRHAKWLALLGDRAYRLALELNRLFNVVRRKIGLPYWSLSAYLKHKVKNAVEFMSNFEEAVSAEARRRGVDGVICGHIHHAAMRDMDGIHYVNDGDWVESCTALVEDERGRFEIVHWADVYEAAQRDESAVAATA